MKTNKMKGIKEMSKEEIEGLKSCLCKALLVKAGHDIEQVKKAGRNSELKELMNAPLSEDSEGRRMSKDKVIALYANNKVAQKLQERFSNLPVYKLYKMICLQQEGWVRDYINYLI